MFAEFDWVEATRSSPILLVLLVCSLVTMAVAIERGMYYRRRSGDPEKTLLGALEFLRKGRVSEAETFCQNAAHPLGQVAAEVMSDSDLLPKGFEERLQVTLSRQKLLLEKHLSVLGSMAAVAPLIGLLGTVVGIMRAFHDMAQVGSAAPSVVAAGVAEALLTTAAGLIVAVPAVLLYNHFARRMSVMLTFAENYTRSINSVLNEQSADPVAGQGTNPEVERIRNAINGPEPVPSPQA
jgi:biopolymer transport protein ExbB